MKRRAVIAITAVMFCSPLAAHADIYQYTDDKGVVHFTNVSGGGKNRKRVSAESEPVRTVPRTRSSESSASPAGAPGAYVDIVNSACNRHGVDPSLVQAIIKVESDFNPYALSRKGAMGLMQLMPQTALDWNVSDSFNPSDNIDGGVRYLRYLLDRYEGNLSLALAAYNSGETAVKRWGTIPPFRETQNYVQRILKIYNGRAWNGGRAGGSSKNYVNRYTIYMGYSDDGSLVLTDNPSNHRDKKLKAKKNL
jgi:hypothetical protein